MSYWNHRVVRKAHPRGEVSYGIHEVFYNKDGSVYAYTKEPVEVSCESIDDLHEYVGWMQACLTKPILIDGEVEFVTREEK